MNVGTLDVIDRLPFELQARLEADEFFDDIPVVVAEEGDVAMMIAKKQAVVTEKSGRVGVAVIVLQILADDDYPEVGLGPMTLRPAFQVVENVELNKGANGTQKSARRVARRIRDVIKTLSLGGIVTEFKPDKPAIEPVELAAELGKTVRAYQVNFVTYESDDEPAGQVDPPQFAAVDGPTPQVEITCATAGAAIWYSLDGSYPAPGRPGASLYTAPLDIPEAGLTVRAACYQAGLIASQVLRRAVTVEFV